MAQKIRLVQSLNSEFTSTDKIQKQICSLYIQCDTHHKLIWVPFGKEIPPSPHTQNPTWITLCIFESCFFEFFSIYCASTLTSIVQCPRFTTSYVSSDLRQADLRTVSLSQTTVGNMEVRVYSGVSEVAITYKVDDFSIELFVSLPDSYPLQPPSIREGKRVKMDPAQWRKWMLQLTIFVTNQVCLQLQVVQYRMYIRCLLGGRLLLIQSESSARLH